MTMQLNHPASNDAVLKDTALKDTVLKDAALKDTVLKDTVLKDTVLKDAALTATDEHRQTLTDAVAAARLARRRVERELRRSELERDQTARALEQHLHPLDESRREQLRIAYADAAASVAVHRDAFERAVGIENAATVLAAALDDPPMGEIADDLLQLLDQRQRTRQGNILPFSARSRWPSPDARAPLH
ncbi:hypothetical protein [Microbacterium sp.]|uniref:hypothetical protein n=1 Tax=Microbacterium sp. TaxID=51671 RepID=UPI003C1582D0